MANTNIVENSSVNYLAEFYKNSDKDYSSFFSSYVDNAEIIKVKKEIEKLASELAKKRESYSIAIQSRYNSEFIEEKNKTVLCYHKRSSGTTYFDSETGARISYYNNENQNVEVITTKVGTYTKIFGYCPKLGSVIVRLFSYRINQDETNCNIKFMKEFIIPIIEWEAQVYCMDILGHTGEVRGQEETVVEKFCREARATGFIKLMYGVDLSDAEFNITYKELKEYIFNNKSAEIILKTCPKNSIKEVLNKRVDKAMPVYSILGIDKVSYNKLVENDCLNKFIELEKNYNLIPVKNRIIKKTPSEWCDFIIKCKDYEEDLDFYKIVAGRYNAELPVLLVNYYCISAPNRSYYTTVYRDSEVAPIYKFGKWCDYVVSGTIDQGFTSVDKFCGCLQDYIHMCLTMGIKPVLYSNQIVLTHDITSRNYKIVLDEQQEVIFANRYKDEKDERVHGKFGTYHIIVPKKSDDIKLEGATLSHCCGSYLKRILEGETKIYFLRVKPNESLITVEIRDGAIVQARGSHNRGLDNNETAALRTYALTHNYRYDI